MSDTESLFTKISNLVSYKVNQATTDPDAQRFAAEQAVARKKQDEAAAATAATAAAKADADKKQAVNYKDATYSTYTLVGEIIKYTIISFTIFVCILFAVYTGHLAANDAIGRKIQYRILYFIYGMIFCIFVAPYYLIQYLRGNRIKSYSILPISTDPIPPGIGGFFASFISYTPDQESIMAMQNYEAALKASVG